MRLHKGETSPAGRAANCGGRKLRSGRIAWCRRWVEPAPAKAGGVKGGKWFSLIDKVIRPATLEAAWQRVARNKGAAGVDGQSVERFASQSERYLLELHTELKAGTYRPSPVKRVEIPKADGKTRPLGIPTVKDRIVQGALKMVIEPIFEAQFREGSYGFRPGRGCRACPCEGGGTLCGKSICF
jgi:RNA-directed DNA polymerase